MNILQSSIETKESKKARQNKKKEKLLITEEIIKETMEEFNLYW